MMETKVGLKGAIGATFGSFLRERLNLTPEQNILESQHDFRANTVIAVRFLLMLLIVTLITQQVSKKMVIRPVVNHLWGGSPSQIFLNSEMKAEALHELRFYEHGLRFEALLDSNLALSEAEKEARLAHKAKELNQEFVGKSRDALSNRFADLVAFGVFIFILLTHNEKMAALNTFFYYLLSILSDSAKAFILILSTDIFVGFHSAHGWEVLLEWVAHHLGLAANHALIFVFIATVPVILDTLIKYGIFQFSQVSQTTVAAFKSMNH